MVRKVSDLSHLSETDKAYLAGIIDGEGCIDVNGKYHSPRLVITQANNIFLVAMKELWGGLGNVHTLKVNEYRPREVSRWSLTNNQCLLVLELVLPYLRIKHLQASLVIDMKKRKKSGYYLTEEDIKHREDTKVRVSELNQRSMYYDA